MPLSPTGRNTDAKGPELGPCEAEAATDISSYQGMAQLGMDSVRGYFPVTISGRQLPLRAAEHCFSGSHYANSESNA
jgi:hypothetical protein